MVSDSVPSKSRWVLVSKGDLYQMILGKTDLSADELSLAMSGHEAVTFVECRYFQYTTGQAQDPNGRLVQLFNHQLLPFPMSYEGGTVTMVPTLIIETEQSGALREQVAAMLNGLGQLEAEIRSRRSGLVLAPAQTQRRS
jgi:hypothetical protein